MKLRALALPSLLTLSVVAAFVAAPALAHPGHANDGFRHPFTGLDHIFAMIGVGLWAALLAAPSLRRFSCCRWPSW